MMNHKIVFETIPWKPITFGVKQKEFIANNKRIRILLLEDGFEDLNWCEKGHIGYVLSGAMTLNFTGNMVNYNVGDIFFIERGHTNKHKAIIEKGNFVEILLIEDLEVE